MLEQKLKVAYAEKETSWPMYLKRSGWEPGAQPGQGPSAAFSLRFAFLWVGFILRETPPPVTKIILASPKFYSPYS